jgi:hypothetical protein
VRGCLCVCARAPQLRVCPACIARTRTCPAILREPQLRVWPDCIAHTRTCPAILVRTKYHAIVQSIKSLDERKDAMGRDTFSLPEWWRFNSGALPHFSFVLRALLTNAPNSCPLERLFSMFNATFGEEQRRAFRDYLELAMQSQYNKRNL